MRRAMTFGMLALVAALGLGGPLLTGLTGWRLPVMIGELGAGIVFGTSGLDVLNPHDATFSFLADIGFALTMFVAGSHVPIGNASIRPQLLRGLLRATGVGVVAAAISLGLTSWLHLWHVWMFAIVLASSSAAIVLPALTERGTVDSSLELVAQVAIADVASMVLLPLTLNAGGWHQLLGIAGVVVAGAVLGLVLWLGRMDRVRTRLHEISERHHLALELRVSILMLAALAAVAAFNQMSVMLAGFVAGLAVAATGEPRRLASQLFALSEGFLSPIFFVWLGATLSLQSLLSHPAMLWLGLLLGLGSIACHSVQVVFGQPWSQSVMASAQLGVPVAAVAIGQQSGALSAGVDAALILGLLVTLAGFSLANAVAGRGAAASSPAR